MADVIVSSNEDGVEFIQVPMRILIATRYRPTMNEVAIELGLGPEPFVPDDPTLDEKNANEEWRRRFFDMTGRATTAAFEAEWRVRFRWADACLSMHEATRGEQHA